jgi:hypothetical protein
MACSSNRLENLKTELRIWVLIFVCCAVTSCTIGLPVYAAETSDVVNWSNPLSRSSCAADLAGAGATRTHVTGDSEFIGSYLLQANGALAQHSFLTWVALRNGGRSGQGIAFDEVLSVRRHNMEGIKSAVAAIDKLGRVPHLASRRILLAVDAEFVTDNPEDQSDVLQTAILLLKLVEDHKNVKLILGTSVVPTTVTHSRSRPRYQSGETYATGRDLFLGSKLFSPEVDVLASVPVVINSKMFFDSSNEFLDAHRSELQLAEPSTGLFAETRLIAAGIPTQFAVRDVNVLGGIEQAMARSIRQARFYSRTQPNVFTGMFEARSESKNRFFAYARDLPSDHLRTYIVESIASAFELLKIPEELAIQNKVDIAYATNETIDFETNLAAHRRPRSRYQNAVGALDVVFHLNSNDEILNRSVPKLLAADPYFYPMVLELLNRENKDVTSVRAMRRLTLGYEK